MTSRPGRDDSPSLWLLAGVALIVVLGVFFRFYNLDRKVFWEDEVLGAIHALGYTEAEIVAASPSLTDASDVQRYFQPNSSLGLAKTIDSLASEDPQHPPAYYILAHLLMRLFDGSVETMRTLAAIFGVLVLPCAFWLALELFGSLRTALLAVALVAVSPFFILYAQEAREYSMWTVAIALLAVLFLRAIRLRAPVHWIAYSAVLASSLYIDPLTGLVALGFAVYLLIRERGQLRRALIACVLADLAAVALFIPWIKVMATSPGLGRGMAAIFTSKLSLAEIARSFARDLRFVFFDIGPAHVGPLSFSAIDALFTLIVVALCAYAFLTLVRSTAFPIWGFIIIGLCLSMMPLVLRDLLVGGNFVSQTRYFLPLLLGVQLAVAALFGRSIFARTSPRAGRAIWTVLLVFVLGSEVLSCTIASQAATWWNKDDERAPAVAAIINAAPSPLVVSDYFTPSILELSLYLDPTVPMRLNLRCAQCALSRANADFATLGYGRSIFSVQMHEGSNARYLWVDPHPFPAQPRPLNMFAFVTPSH
jgi:uncharacterized membrane protein